MHNTGRMMGGYREDVGRMVGCSPEKPVGARNVGIDGIVGSVAVSTQPTCYFHATIGNTTPGI
jgi:hypothetical protein